MASQANKWDQSVFESTLQEYQKWSKRTWQVIINTKAWFIARKATWFTMKADRARVKTGLGQIVTVNRLSKSGKKVVRKRVIGSLRKNSDGIPLAALIIQKREASAGNRSPFYGRSKSAGIALMNRLIMKLMNSRERSIAFLKSGWLKSIRTLTPLADRKGQPAMDSEAKQIGRPKGDCKPADSSFKPICEIINLASARRDHRGALSRYGSRGLQRAFDDETASMKEYSNMKMRADAEKWNKEQERRSARLAI
jgi:hypothetical protein